MRIVTVFLLLALVRPWTAEAVVDVSTSELQESAAVMFPTGDLLPEVSGYEGFELQNEGNAENGVYAIYQAKLSLNPAIEEELPRLKLAVYAYSSQDSAESAFKSLRNSGSFYSGQKSILEENSHEILYKSAPGLSADLFGTINTEDDSLHLLEVNGNLLLHASLYRNSGDYYRPNIEAIAKVFADSATAKILFEEALDYIKLSLGILYQPKNSEYSAISEKSSLNLSELYSIPNHGNVNFEIYINSPASAVGTILDSSGIGASVDGDVYLYVDKDGYLLAGIYAPDFDSDCDIEAGWYRIKSDEAIRSYEWNSVSLSFGVDGFAIYLEGRVAASCDVSQARSDSALYFGDFPSDSIFESFSGYVKSLKTEFAVTKSGSKWDEVLANQLFVDLSNNDPDVDIFQYLQEAGIMLGSEGYLRPDEKLNRAEMVKILLKAYGYSAEEGPYPFWDAPADAWYSKYLATAYEIGMVEGHEDGRFLPSHEINRAEFFSMLLRISGAGKLSYDGQYSDVGEEDWYLNAAAFAAAKGLVAGDTFDAAKLITRREAAKAIYAMIK